MKRPAILIMTYLFAVAAMFLIFCEPAEDSQRWILDLLLSKAGGVIAGWVAWELNKKLQKRDETWK